MILLFKLLTQSKVGLLGKGDSELDFLADIIIVVNAGSKEDEGLSIYRCFIFTDIQQTGEPFPL